MKPGRALTGAEHTLKEDDAAVWPQSHPDAMQQMLDLLRAQVTQAPDADNAVKPLDSLCPFEVSDILLVNDAWSAAEPPDRSCHGIVTLEHFNLGEVAAEQLHVAATAGHQFEYSAPSAQPVSAQDGVEIVLQPAIKRLVYG